MSAHPNDDGTGSVDDLERALDSTAIATGFSGVVRIDRAGDVELAKAYGLADRRHAIALTVDTQLGIASGTKGLTALTVVSLVEEGALALAATARSVLGDDLPLVADDVTVEQLLSHRSGIGDYLDESVLDDDVTAYVMPVPVQELATTEQYLAVLDGYPTAFAAGTSFAYCNGGYVLLALIAERVGGEPFHELVRHRVTEPAGLTSTAFLRSDELPGTAATGYLATDDARTNVLHLPVRGSGDGGIYTTAADVSALWAAFFDARIVSAAWVDEMVRPRRGEPEAELDYGLGLWLHPGTRRAELHGYDAGVSFRSVHDPVSRRTWTVVSNTSEGTWPLEHVLKESWTR